MTSRSDIEIRRCRPLLGTFVEITASGPDEAGLQDSINAAFAAVENIQSLMSAHDPASELSRLNRAAISRPVVVSRELFAVLRRADRLAAETDGAFDYTIGPVLARWGYLPASLKRKRSGDWRHVLLLPGRSVYFLHPLALDLGGIAKGFAVDAAIRVLGRRGAASAIVNAGGDLRVFGARPAVVHLRHPSVPQVLAQRLELADGALATSSPCFTERRWHRRPVSHLVNPLDGNAVTGNLAVSVRAAECWLADALTKAVLNAPDAAEAVLRRHGAEAFVLSA
jgi:thiamine biosynthesis lipoprotein